MILVDSSVWIDYFRGTACPQSDRLDNLLGREPLLVGDLILTKVLQGFTSKRDFDTALRTLSAFDCIDLSGRDIAIKAARTPACCASKGSRSARRSTRSSPPAASKAASLSLFSDRYFGAFVD